MFDNYNSAQQAILSTTLKIIVQKELQATSMALISKESGVSTGNIYHYFKSKEDIINELYIAIVQDCAKVVLADFFNNNSIFERFCQVWKSFIQFSCQHQEAFLFYEQYSFSPYIEETVKEKAIVISICHPLVELYTNAIGQRLFTDHISPQMMITMHYGSYVYAVKAAIQNCVDLNDSLIDSIIQNCWNSVLCEQKV